MLHSVFLKTRQKGEYLPIVLILILSFILNIVGITWGLTIGPRSQRNSTVVAAAIGVILLVLGGVALYGFAANTPVPSHG